MHRTIRQFVLLLLSATLVLPVGAKVRPKKVKADSTVVDSSTVKTPLKEKIASKLTKNDEASEYKDELGFFQKAYRDLSDPRFMFHDDKAKLDLGFGGTAKVECGCSVYGSTGARVFKPLAILVPTDPSLGFGARIAGSELHFKARATLGKRNIIAFVKLGGTDDNKVELDQAYLSYGGFSMGKIPTFFADLEYGIRTETMAATQVSRNHILIGYRHRFWGETLEVGVSAEEPELDVVSYEIPNTYSNYQLIPDFTLRAKYNWEHGHVQLGFLTRCLTYWTNDTEKPDPGYFADGTDVYKFGYGLSLSGNYRPNEKIKTSFAIVGGSGIAYYLEGMADYQMDLYMSDKTSDQCVVMNPLPVLSSTLAFQYNWTPKLYSGILAQYMCAFEQPDDIHKTTNYKNSLMGTLTLFWDVRDFFYLGFEYIFGFRSNYDLLQDGRNFGQTHRLSIMAAYQF